MSRSGAQAPPSPRRRRPGAASRPSAPPPPLLLAALLALAAAAAPAARAAGGTGEPPGTAFHRWRGQFVDAHFRDDAHFHVAIGVRDMVQPHDPRLPLPPAPPVPPLPHQQPQHPAGTGAAAAQAAGVAAAFAAAAAARIGGKFLTHRLNARTLLLDGEPYVIAGAELGHAAALAASGREGRKQVLRVLDEAEALGLNTLRLFAFDGPSSFYPAPPEPPLRMPRAAPPGARAAPAVGGNGTAAAAAEGPEFAWAAAAAAGKGARRRPGAWAPMQPAPGVFDRRVLRDGLDWVIAQAAARGMRTLLVLTDAGGAAAGAAPASGGGGAPAGASAGRAGYAGAGAGAGAGGAAERYCRWVDSGAGELSIGDFYANDTVKSVFLDHVGVLLSRVNSVTGYEYRFDPAILGWQLALGPLDPGFPGSERLKSWVKQMAAYVRQRAPHHAIASGVDGTFGPATPHHRRRNGARLPPASPLRAGPPGAPHDAACTGPDFYLHTSPWEVDLATFTLDPAGCMACGDACMRSWAEEAFSAHLQDAVRMQKPLLAGGVGAGAPPALRAALVSQLRRQVAAAAEAGHHVAGWMVELPVPLAPAPYQEHPQHQEHQEAERGGGTGSGTSGGAVVFGGMVVGVGIGGVGVGGAAPRGGGGGAPAAGVMQVLAASAAAASAAADTDAAAAVERARFWQQLDFERCLCERAGSGSSSGGGGPSGGGGARVWPIEEAAAIRLAAAKVAAAAGAAGRAAAAREAAAAPS